MVKNRTYSLHGPGCPFFHPSASGRGGIDGGVKPSGSKGGGGNSGKTIRFFHGVFSFAFFLLIVCRSLRFIPKKFKKILGKISKKRLVKPTAFPFYFFFNSSRMALMFRFIFSIIFRKASSSSGVTPSKVPRKVDSKTSLAFSRILFPSSVI